MRPRELVAPGPQLAQDVRVTHGSPSLAQEFPRRANDRALVTRLTTQGVDPRTERRVRDMRAIPGHRVRYAIHRRHGDVQRVGGGPSRSRIAASASASADWSRTGPPSGAASLRAAAPGSPASHSGSTNDETRSSQRARRPGPRRGSATPSGSSAQSSRCRRSASQGPAVPQAGGRTQRPQWSRVRQLERAPHATPLCVAQIRSRAVRPGSRPPGFADSEARPGYIAKVIADR